MAGTVSTEGTNAEYRDRVAQFIDRTQLEGQLARIAANLSDEGLNALLGSARQLQDSSVERAAKFSRGLRPAVDELPDSDDNHAMNGGLNG